MTIYSDLWYKVIATPRYDKRIAQTLRLAHNHLIQRRTKSNVAGEWGVEVSQIENGRATGLRAWSLPVGYEWADYAEARYE